MNDIWNLYPEQLNRIQKAFWAAFYLVFGGGVYFFLYHLLLPSRDASTPPAWGRAAKQSYVSATVRTHGGHEANAPAVAGPAAWLPELLEERKQ